LLSIKINNEIIFANNNIVLKSLNLGWYLYDSISINSKSNCLTIGPSLQLLSLVKLLKVNPLLNSQKFE
tara:strand:+ start:3207 stop:3413 length:207 start_codon:yes stop_codon:yes gene_type:complete